MRATVCAPSQRVVCVLDPDIDALRKTTRFLSLSAWDVRPFNHPDALLEYARNRSPAAAILDFGTTRRGSENVAERLRKLSPQTAIVISVKVHRSQVQGLLCGNELINLINEQCTARAMKQIQWESTAARSAMVPC